MRKKTQTLAAGISMILVLAAALRLHTARTQEQTVEFAVFDTFCSLHFFRARPADVRPLGRAVIARLQRLHNRIDVFDPESELSRLNRTAAASPFRCSGELWDILQRAREAWEVTGGEFDVSIGPLMHLWGFHGRRKTIPSEAEIAAALRKVGLQKVVFDEQDRSVAFPVPGMRLDLGGLAKGYALDLAVGMWRSSPPPCSGVLFDFGGNIFAQGRNDAGRRLTVGIRSPRDARRVFRNCIVDGSYIATSANYERALRIGERRIGHIVSPFTGRPVDRYASVSILAGAGWQSDVFSTAVFAGGGNTIRTIRSRFPDVQVVLQQNPAPQ